MFARIASSAAVVAVVVVLSGCVAEPAPSPTPTAPFSSEEEAFAAAEETYRAYVDALNDVDLSDPETFEAVYAWTTGELNASDREGLSSYHAEGVSVSGTSHITLVEGLANDEQDGQTVALAVCLDVSDVQLRAEDGTSLVAPDRTDVQTLTVSTTTGSSSSGLVISSIGPRDGSPTCG